MRTAHRSTAEPAQPVPSAAPEINEAVRRWLDHLGGERRYAANTLEAYARDVRQFFEFLTQHTGRRPTLADLARLRPQDVRAFLASLPGRRRARAFVDARARGHPVVRPLSRSRRRGGAESAAGRARKVPKTLPKPLSVAAAKQVVDVAVRAGDPRPPWILARDAAVSDCFTAADCGFPKHSASSARRSPNPALARPSS